ncbi:hypothetical protein ISCGN_003956, partial [Ixodes scapularis]
MGRHVTQHIRPVESWAYLLFYTVWNDEDITFAELLKMCQRYATGFQGHGVKKGDKVLVHLDNSLENIIAMYSVMFAGGVAAVSDPILSNDDILHRIRDSNASHILTTASEAKRFSDFRNKLDVKVTTVLGSAHWIQLLGKAIEKRGIQLDNLSTVIVCGTKVTSQVLRQIERSFGLAIVKDVYGSTELGQICRPPPGASGWYGIGFPAPMVQVKVVDVRSGNVLGPNEEGEVLVKTPSSMVGYYGQPEATSQTITPDGWVRTGDICYYNEVGQFFYVERMSQFFRCMGIQVAPCSIESVLLSHDGIEEAAVIGVPHPRYQEAAMALVVLKKSCSKITEAELQNFVA